MRLNPVVKVAFDARDFVLLKVQGIVAGVGQVADALTQHQFGRAAQHKLNPVAVGLQERPGDDERQRDLDNTHDPGVPVRVRGAQINEHVVV